MKTQSRTAPHIMTRITSTFAAAMLLLTQPGPVRVAAAGVWDRAHYGTAADVAFAAPASARPQTSEQAPQQQAAEVGAPVLSEIAPASAPDKPAWVEIAVQSVLTYTLFLPALLYNSAQTATMSAQGPMMAADTLAGASLAGFSLSDEDGNIYRLPANLPELPFNGFIVVVFGPGTDDTAMRNGVLTLYAPAMAAALEADGDQISLYNASSTLIDFVAWGKDPGEDANAAVAAELWGDGQYLIYDQGFGGEVALSPKVPNQSFGTFNQQWDSYRASASTRGKVNQLPGPMGSTIPDGGSVSSETFGVAWTPTPDAVAYDFDLSTSADFSTTLVHTRTVYAGWNAGGPQPGGIYYWRVRSVNAQGGTSGYFGPNKLKSVVMSAQAASQNATGNSTVSMAPRSVDGPLVSKMLLSTNNYRVQRKDTTSLDIGGGAWNVDSKGNPFGLPRTGDTSRWDGPHYEAGTLKPLMSYNGYDNMMCVRTTTSMLTSYYGGQLSIDRLSYQAFEQYDLVTDQKNRPEGDFGFNKGIGSESGQKYIIGWALGVGEDNIEFVSHCPDPIGAGIKGYDADDATYTCPAGTSSPIAFSLVQSLIDSGRPFASVNLKNAHMRVVDGYRYTNASNIEIHIADPVPTGSCEGPGNFCTKGARWEPWETFQNTVERSLYVKDNVATNAHFSESTFNKDSDNDGMNDFDEIKRFKTNPFDEDTDGDGLKDKEDVAYYVFNSADKYAKRSAIAFPFIVENGTQVFDFRRMELKPDNDMDKALDGCEDADRNGKQNGFETSNFSPTGGVGCKPDLEMVYPLNNYAIDIGPINKPSPLLVRVRLHLPEAYPQQSYTQGQFKVFIDKPGSPGATKQAPIYAFVQPFDDQVNLFVNLPTQDVEGKYTVRVEHTASSGIYNVSATDGIKYTKFLVKPNVGLSFDTSLGNPIHPLTVPVPPGQIDAIKLFAAQLPPSGTLSIITTGATATLVLPKTPLGNPRVINTGFAALASTTPTGTNFLASALLAAQTQISQSDPGPDESRYIIAVNGAQPDESTLDVMDEPLPNFGETHLILIGAGNSQADYQRRLDEGYGDPSEYRHAPLSTTVGGVPLGPDWVVADQLLGTADTMLHQVRFDEGFGTLAVGTTVTRDIPVEGDSVVFNALFNRAGAWDLFIVKPDGSVVTTTDPSASFYRDERAMRVRVQQPAQGLWKFVLRNISPSGAPVDFATFTSGQTPVVALLLPAVQKVREAASRNKLDRCNQDGVPGCPITLTIALGDGIAPVPGATVVAKIFGPNGSTQDTRLIEQGPGIYSTAPFTAPLPGAYQVRIVVQGTHNGQPFTRYVQGTFVQSKPVAYVYNEQSDLDQFKSYLNLLDNAGLDLVPLSAYALTTTQLSNYRGFIIASDSALAGQDWATPALRNALNGTGSPILGLGEGGYALFNDLELNLGSASTVTRTGNMTRTQAFNPGAPVWSQPFLLMGNSPYTVFNTSAGLRLNAGTAVVGFDVIGTEPGTPNFVNMGRENTRYALWGFGNGPLSMTENGKRAFVNMAALLFPQ